eukprot:1530666-Rhodomonas_salina.1
MRSSLTSRTTRGHIGHEIASTRPSWSRHTATVTSQHTVVKSQHLIVTSQRTAVTSGHVTAHGGHVTAHGGHVAQVRHAHLDPRHKVPSPAPHVEP